MFKKPVINPSPLNYSEVSYTLYTGILYKVVFPDNSPYTGLIPILGQFQFIPHPTTVVRFLTLTGCAAQFVVFQMF